MQIDEGTVTMNQLICETRSQGDDKSARDPLLSFFRAFMAKAKALLFIPGRAPRTQRAASVVYSVALGLWRRWNE